MALRIEYQVQSIGDSKVRIGMGSSADDTGTVDVTSSFAAQAGQPWQTAYIRLSCFEQAGLDMSAVAYPLVIRAGEGLVLQLESAEIVANPGDAACEL